MQSLKIGDEQNAIILIMQSQTDPQKAVAELVENSIDAHAKNVTITRHRKAGRVYLTVADDGEGIKADQKGEPDIEYVATHICDSIKKNLLPAARVGVQGQFGIGLLGYAAVGEELVLRSRRDGSRTRAIRFVGSEYDTDVSAGELRRPGTEAEIGCIHGEIQHRLTAEKLQRYLSEELRDRIRQSRVRIEVFDKVGVHKRLIVAAREYAGIPLAAGRKAVATSAGLLKIDLYAAFPKEGERALVSVARQGTRLLRDILDLEEFKRSPWNLNEIEGVVDLEGLQPAPTTRKGFQLDDAYASLQDELKRLEPGIELELKLLRKKRDEEITRETLTKLQEAFAAAMEELSEDFTWFERPGSSVAASGVRPRGAGGGKSRPMRISLGGPLEEIRVTPQIAVLGIGETRRLLAKAYDPDGSLILTGVSYMWSVSPEAARLISVNGQGPAAVVEARDKEGETKVRVRGQLKGVERWGESTIKVMKSRNEYGFPPPEAVHDPLASWRSRYRAERGVVEYNTGHRDYERAKQPGQKGVIRYLAKLYAKELVLLNFPGVTPAMLLEYMVEVSSRVEANL